MEISRDFLIQLLIDLVQIDSTNPSCTPTGAGEEQISRFILDVLQQLGIHAEIYEPAPGRFNVLSWLPGSGKGRSLMLNAHMDTVGVDGMLAPFSAKIENGLLFGRGSQDMKGSLAACIAVMKAINDSGLKLAGDLYVAAVADEEYLSLGTIDLLNHCRTDGAVVAEPTDLKIAIAHRGFSWIKLDTFGRAAHGSRYQDGVDANMRMGWFLSRLDKLERELRSRNPHPLVGTPSLHAAKLFGGREWSIYSDRCELNIERRTIPGEDNSTIYTEIKEILDELSELEPTFEYSLETRLTRDPFEIDPNADIVKSLITALELQVGKGANLSGVPFWTDAALLASAGIETALIGPVGGGLHSSSEWVDLNSVVELANILFHTAQIYCNLPKVV